MANKSTTKVRIFRFEKDDEEALAYIMKTTGLNLTGAVRWSLRLTEQLYKAEGSQPVSKTIESAKDAVCESRYTGGHKYLYSALNKSLRKTERPGRYRRGLGTIPSPAAKHKPIDLSQLDLE